MLKAIRKALRKKMQTLASTLGAANAPDSEFSRRIKYRHHTFWSAPNAEHIRNSRMDAGYSLEKWKDVENWQRKLSNKYNAREFAKMHACPVPALYWKGRDCRHIDFSSFPGQYVIRPTIGHSCHSVFLMDNACNLMDRQTYAPAAIVKVLSSAVQANPHLEFLIEEFVRTEQGHYRIPDDYKFYMFNGQLAFIQVINRFSNKEGLTSFYDADWKQLQNINSIYKQAGFQEKPRCFDEMRTCAEKLSRTYEIFVRVDFYATDKGAVFGEFTPTPGLGDAFTAFGDKLLIAHWDTYCKEMI